MELQMHRKLEQVWIKRLPTVVLCLTDCTTALDLLIAPVVPPNGVETPPGTDPNFDKGPCMLERLQQSPGPVALRHLQMELPV